MSTDETICVAVRYLERRGDPSSATCTEYLLMPRSDYERYREAMRRNHYPDAYDVACKGYPRAHRKNVEFMEGYVKGKLPPNSEADDLDAELERLALAEPTDQS